MKIKHHISDILLLFIMGFITSCAQQGAPSGGPQDEDPPVVLGAEPANYSTGFDKKRIVLTFDEYLDMGNFTQELVVSPPMEEKPMVRMRGKSLIIEFEEELKEDATYTFNFGEGIKDLNERNVLLNFEYVFATGQNLDSLSVKGTLKNAFDLSVPENPLYVMLYRELDDSIPLTQIPYYVGRADKEGHFEVNNLRKDVYKLFVLKDANNNFLFDLPSEPIAFLDTSLLVDGDYFRRLLLESGTYDSTDLQPDTTALPIDTTGMSPDSIKMVLDSLEQLKPDFNSIYVDLFMFTEEPTNQFLSDYARDERSKMELVFNLPLTDSFQYKPIFPEFLELDDLIPEFGVKRDTLELWASDTSVSALDTIVLGLSYTMLDSMQTPFVRQDTLMFSYREKKPGNKRRNEEDTEEEKIPVLDVKTIRNRGKHHIYQDLVFTIPQPVKNINPEKFELYIIPDSVEIPVQFNPYIDSSRLNRVRISHDWKEEGNYKLALYPGAITNVYGVTNDTIISAFSIRPLADYGIINLTLEGVEDRVVIELYKKGAFYKRKTVTEPGTYSFDFLMPDTYRIKLVHDRNGNGEWDTGKYLEKRQPERVEFLPKDIEVRANWDHDISYMIGSNDDPPGKKDKRGEENAPLF